MGNKKTSLAMFKGKKLVIDKQLAIKCSFKCLYHIKLSSFNDFSLILTKFQNQFYLFR
jgi:hypothetical protein